MRAGLAAGAASSLPAAPLAFSTAASREVRSATCFSSPTSRCSGTDSTAAGEDSGRAELIGTGLTAGGAVLAGRVEGTLGATALLAGRAALALRAGTDAAAFFVTVFFIAFFVVAFFVAALFVAAFFFAGAFFAGAFSSGVAATESFSVTTSLSAAETFLAVTAAVVRWDVALTSAVLPVLAGAAAFLATAFTDGAVAGLACAAA